MPCCTHGYRCGAGRANRCLVRASGDVRRPMPSCTHRSQSCRQPMPSWMHEHRRGAGHADRRRVCASGDDRRPCRCVPMCSLVMTAHVALHPRASQGAGRDCRRLCVRAAMSDGPCYCVHIGHCRADGPCHLARTSTAVVRAVPTSLALLFTSGDVRRPMLPCTRARS